jgi:RNAse (barnase) inhibitor barstar
MSHSVLSQLAKSGPYRISAHRLTGIQAEAAALAIPTFTIAPQQAATAGEWLQALAGQLAFPAHFGGNFDALYDCLCDAEVINHKACLLLINNIDGLGEEGCDTLIAVLQAVADEWREADRALWVLFNIAQLDLDPLPQK